MPHATLSSGDSGNTGSVTPPPLFPTGDSVVVVIVPVGSDHVVVFVPVILPPAARSPFAASTHPTEAPVLIDLGVPVPSPPAFGQDTTVDSVLTRSAWWDSGGDVAAIFDRVEPFQLTAPVPPCRASAPPGGTLATVLALPAATLPWHGLLDDQRSEAEGEITRSDQQPAVPTAAPPAWLENEKGDETSPADSSGALAATTALAGASYRLVFNKSDGQEGSREPRTTRGRLKPRVRKCLAPRA